MSTAGSEGERTPRDEWVLASMARQLSILEGFEAAAVDQADDLSTCLGWIALRRQAGRYLRSLANWSAFGSFQRYAEPMAAHRSAIEGFVVTSESELARLDGEAREEACRRLGRRLAVVGKGGAGKTLISGTLARLLARRGRRVLAADLDTNPGLTFTLGMPDGEAGLPLEALERHEGAAYGWQLASGLSPAEAVERFAIPAPDGVRYLGLGKIVEPEKLVPRRSVVAIQQILVGFGDPGWDVVGDLEAGTTTLFERYHLFADHVLVVVGPAWRSALTARRLQPLIGDLPTTVIANRFREEPDHPGLHPALRIPFDPEVAEAERLGVAPLDYCPDSPAIRAIDELAERFLAQEVLV